MAKLRFLRLWRDRRGLAALEMAAVAPFLLFMVLACVDYGRMLSQNIELTHAVRAGAQYSITAPNAKTRIEDAVRGALPAKFRTSAVSVTATCHCGVVPDDSTAMPNATPCDSACPAGWARMTRIRATHPFKSYNPMFTQSVRNALRFTEVSGNVTVRHQ